MKLIDNKYSYLLYFFQVLANFNAKDERIRKLFVTELQDCIEEVSLYFFLFCIISLVVFNEILFMMFRRKEHVF